MVARRVSSQLEICGRYEYACEKCAQMKSRSNAASDLGLDLLPLS